MNYFTIFITILPSVSSYNLPFTRRTFLGAAVFNQNIIFSNNNPLKLPEFSFNISKIKNIDNEINHVDPYSHWSLNGIAPPPIKKTLSYQELLQQIHNNSIFTIQIAPQHDSIIATNYQGNRFACQVKDKNFDKLIQESLDENSNLPFIVLPIDENRQKIRNAAQAIFFPSLIFYILADLDIIDYDTNTFASWKDRQEAYKNGKKPTKFLKSLLDKLTEKNNTNSS